MDKNLLACADSFRRENKKATIELLSTEAGYRVVLGDLVKIELSRDDAANFDEVLRLALSLAGYNSDGGTAHDNHEEEKPVSASMPLVAVPLPGAEKTEAQDSAAESVPAEPEPEKKNPPAPEKRGRPRKSGAMKGGVGDDAGDAVSPTLAAAFKVVCRAKEGAIISEAQNRAINGKEIGTLQRGFVRTLAESANKGPSPWTDETVQAAKVIMRET